MNKLSEETYFGKYLVFNKKVIDGRKTAIYYIYNKRDLDFELGKIIFYPAWREFVLEPSNETLFDTKCLSDIQEMISIATTIYNEEKE